MRVLPLVNPTPEQLQVLETDTYRTCIIRGGAGSGKTTAAALRCRKVLAGVAADRRLSNDASAIRLAVLTFNRTLKGYIENFIDEQVSGIPHRVNYVVDTFAGWAMSQIGRRDVIDNRERDHVIAAIWASAAPTSALTGRFMKDEVEYILGRFGSAGLEEYMECERIGRGKPTLATARRRSILDTVIPPYKGVLRARDLVDWSELAEELITLDDSPDYDIIIADEVQDFSVQQVRAIMSRLKEQSSLTLVLDTAQSIYPRGIEWGEAGIDVKADADCHKLLNNYRNSPQIAEFVQPLLKGLRFSEDGTIPDYLKCFGTAGRTPTLVVGRFKKQLAYATSVIKGEVDLNEETVGILGMWGDPKGEIGKALDKAGLDWCTLTQAKEWPTGPVNIGVSTLNSAKGLEFDHVFIVGFDTEFVGSHGVDVEDYDYTHLRQLLAMAITRAKRTVVIGYREDYRTDILDLFDPNTYLVVRE